MNKPETNQGLLKIDIGTAGSIPLLLQTLIPTIAISQKDIVIN